MLGVFVVFNVLYLCGSSPTKLVEDDPRIVGGYDIEISEAPYQVSLMRGFHHSCGGAIIAEDIILTAAHCVFGSRPSSFRVRVGSSSSTRGGEIIRVEDLIWHPKFTYSEMDSDIAILRLEEPLEYNDDVSAIDVANGDDEIDDGELTVVTGWGRTREGGALASTLQKVHVPKIGNDFCQEAYLNFYDITPSMLCAGSPQGGKDACQGDSGGPLVHDDKLFGIVSWGLGCARPNYPGVYASVPALREWIDENIAFMRAKKVLRKDAN